MYEIVIVGHLSSLPHCLRENFFPDVPDTMGESIDTKEHNLNKLVDKMLTRKCYRVRAVDRHCRQMRQLLKSGDKKFNLAKTDGDKLFLLKIVLN